MYMFATIIISKQVNVDLWEYVLWIIFCVWWWMQLYWTPWLLEKNKIWSILISHD